MIWLGFDRENFGPRHLDDEKKYTKSENTWNATKSLPWRLGSENIPGFGDIPWIFYISYIFSRRPNVSDQKFLYRNLIISSEKLIFTAPLLGRLRETAVPALDFWVIFEIPHRKSKGKVTDLEGKKS